MPKIQIARGDNKQVTPHFKLSEFYSKSTDAPQVHPFYSELITSAEYLRNHYGSPWRITSTFRTERNEREILAALGQKFFIDEHMLGDAYDSQPVTNTVEIMADLGKQFLNAGPVYQDLRKIGITGFGLYDTFIHLDCRTKKLFHKDAFGLVAHWDSRRENAGSPWGPAFQKKNAVKSPPTKMAAPLFPAPVNLAVGAAPRSYSAGY